MELTGKAKEDFEKWFIKNGAFIVLINFDTYEWDIEDVWEKLPNSMQYGVYVDWFDTIPKRDSDWSLGLGIIYNVCCLVGYEGFTIHKARTEAIQKANEIYNIKVEA